MSKSKYEQFFRQVDTDGSGSLSYNELAVFLKKNCGYSDEQIKQIFNSADLSGGNEISLADFMEAMGQTHPEKHRAAGARSVFRSFDTNGDGTLSKSELGSALEQLGEHLTPKELDRLMQMMDKQGTGKITYEEFIAEAFGEHA